MAEYKRNHSVPQFMLRYWVDETTPHKGVHVYEVNLQKTNVSTSLGGKPFSFAITKDLYIHTADGFRAVGLEKWFSGLEGSLAALVRNAHSRDTGWRLTDFDFTKAMMAIAGLECRSAYNIRKLQDAIERDPSVRTTISVNPERPIEQLVLENIIHSVTEQIAFVTPTEMTFWIAPHGKCWVVGDRPYFNHPELEFRFVVLTNKVLMSYRRADESSYLFSDANDDMLDMMNQLITLNAREWLVASTPAELAKYSTLFQSDDWKNSVASEKVTWIPIRSLTSGWTINQ